VADVVIEPLTGSQPPSLIGVQFAVPALGYEWAEYSISGTARAYARQGSGLAVVEEAGYTTRVMVFRPVDPAAFNGTVWVEWLNVSGGLDAAPDWGFVHTEAMRAGAAWVCVSAQQIGVRGGDALVSVGMPTPGLVGSDPERYGTLTHPGDRFSYDIFSQAGAVARQGTGTTLEGLPIERVVAIGESQSAFRLATYANDVDPGAQVFDGFLIHARGGTGAPLEDDGPALQLDDDPVFFRTDRRVPVLCVEAETDLINLGYASARQDDDDSFVLWEIAGTSHADVYVLAVNMIDTGRLPIAELAAAWRPTNEVLGMPLDLPVNTGPQHYVMNAAVSHFDRWLRDGTRPPAASRLEMADGAFVTDEHGNVRGGIRSPHVDVPTAILSGLSTSVSPLGFLAGTTTPFDAAKLAALYSSRADYLTRFDAATDAAVAAGFFLPADAAEVKAIAAENCPLP
jgi:hypothetical protein